jgi:two-component system chemotaxis response regulator CheY
MIQKILIVDDSPISRKILKSCIPKDRGYELFEAGDGQAGVEKYREFRPDVTFMDLTMPVKDGACATEEIRAFDPNAIIIVCTADIQVKSIANVLGLGALMVVKKPPTREGIADALSQAAARIG